VEDPLDRRHKQIGLTEAGVVVVADAKQARVEEMARRLVGLPPDLLHRLLSTMSEVVMYLRDQDAHQTDDHTNAKH
jgi:DNA-binding MarR family transcriptional regulator